MSDARSQARTGVWLGTATGLTAWRERISTRHRDTGLSPLDWFVRLEALSAPREKGVLRAPVPVARLAESFGTSRDTLDEGTVYTAYIQLCDALGGRVSEMAGGVRAQSRLYQQARMATFLFYRDGFLATLEAVPFTAEAAVHGYCRVVLDWARHWPGLTAADARERAAAEATHDVALRRGRHRDRFLRTTRTVLPLIVENDVRSLTHLAQLEASEIGSTQTRAVGETVAVMALLDQLVFAASHIVEDATLTSLTATNMARLHTNDALGGALLRARLRPRDALILESRVVEEIRGWLLQPRADAVAAGKASVVLAQIEAEYAALSVVRRVFAGEQIDD